MDKVISPIRCANCGEVTIFEIIPPRPGKSKDFQFRCPNGHLATNPQGGCEVVDLSKYDESKLKRVTL